jgi:carbon monoxide dehydrogenase subunit G
VLLDVERIAPCVPGAAITGRDGEDYRGKMKVKLGPVGLTYNGTLRIASQDEAARVAVIEGGAREARGNGTAKATVTCRLAEAGGKTDVLVETELDITGKPAQFGRGVFTEVAGALIGQFADNLAKELTASTPAPEPESGEPEPTAAAEPIDLLNAAGVGSAARLAVPVAAAALLLAIVLALRGRTHRS